MQFPAERIELVFESAGINIQLSRQAEEAEIVHRLRRLDLPACLAELGCAHVTAGPAGVCCRNGCRVDVSSHESIYRLLLLELDC
jgi:hypothetical protein